MMVMHYYITLMKFDANFALKANTSLITTSIMFAFQNRLLIDTIFGQDDYQPNHCPKIFRVIALGADVSY